MRALLLRTTSVPDLRVPHHSPFSGSPRVANNVSPSQRIPLHLEVGCRSNFSPVAAIRRVFSEADVIRSEIGFSRLSGVGSRSSPAIIPEEECVFNGDEKGCDLKYCLGGFPESAVSVEDLGGGIGKGRNSGSGGGGDCTCTGGNADWRKIGAYYQEMLRSDPTNSLLLRNYGQFLHEVEGDVIKAEEYYGRAILASPGDGEVLALYGKLIWETQRDEDRAKSYFDRAVDTSPDDCTVLGSYAHFMWEAEDEGDEERDNEGLAAMVETF